MQETDSQSQEQATATKAASAPAKSRTLWGDAFKRLRKNKLAVIGVCWIIIVVLVALTADLWAKPWLGSPTASDSTTMAETSLLAPCAEHPFGTDALGRDWFTRIIYGGRLSLLIGLLGQLMLLFFGTILGVASGYYGGWVDQVIQRATEFLGAIPDIPLFMALAAAIPVYWSPIAVYFMLTLILSFVRWGGLARQVRGLILSLREREYVLAAKSAGAADNRIMFRHLLPGTMSHVIVIATLAIPGMILAETTLSWLGLGLRPPLTSWGVLLQDAATVRAIHNTPWELWTIPFILLTVLAYNMLGDGLRDALDPYAGR